MLPLNVLTRRPEKLCMDRLTRVIPIQQHNPKRIGFIPVFTERHQVCVGSDGSHGHNDKEFTLNLLAVPVTAAGGDGTRWSVRKPEGEQNEEREYFHKLEGIAGAALFFFGAVKCQE